MADFLKAFESIDTDYSGEITREELEAYCKKQNFDDKFITKWLMLFDMDNSGTITVEEYCEVLGLKPNEEYMEQVVVNRVNAAPGDSQEEDKEVDDLEGVRILFVDKEMPDDLLRLIARLAREGQKKYDLEKDVAKYVKDKLDELDGCQWQLVVGRFQYGSFCTHETGRLAHLYVDRFAVLAWRTPNY